MPDSPKTSRSGDNADKPSLRVGEDGLTRCAWPNTPLYQHYHDTEWARPTFDDRDLFEKLCLEGFQAGLSWITVLKKRPRFREVFHNFDVARVAAMTDDDVARLLGDAGIIRHRGKINAAIHNAGRVLEIQQERSLADYLWSFAPPLSPTGPARLAELKSTTEASTKLSKSLKKRGFKFVGPTTMYALMQAMGMVNDHVDGCYCRDETQRAQASLRAKVLT